MERKDIVVLAICALPSLGVGALQYHNQERDFEIKNNNLILYRTMDSDNLRWDYVEPKKSIEVIFPIYVHSADKEIDRVNLIA
ncbi:hypothetical protein J4477_01205 [Candidatus Pacearchaeota archaeon]|nr:hypothetical protein [Candidatus Pacearchaeota archaeon]